MFNDVDETLRQLLTTDVPIDRGEVDISFERPTREWSSRLSKPTLNLFLFDVRERMDLRDTSWVVTRTEDGLAKRDRPPRRVDLSYVVTAWTREPADEHRILAAVLACMYRTETVDTKHHQGDLRNATYPLLVRVTPPDHLARPHDMWGVLDNDLRASLTWVATTPLDAFVPIVGPLVRTRELEVGRIGEEWRESFTGIGGVVHARGDTLAGIANARVSVAGTALEGSTDGTGKFVFEKLPPGEHRLEVRTADGKTAARDITIPGENYDIEV